MSRFIHLLFLMIVSLSLSACQTPGQSVYDFRQAGQSVIVDFGTVLDVRPITIKGQNTGVGAGVGAVAGLGAGSNIGQGDGAIAGAVGGMIVGAIAGAAAEQALADQEGLDYTIILESGKVITVSQYLHKKDVRFTKGARVMVQTSGSYQRVLPADHLPTQVNRPKGIKVID